VIVDARRLDGGPTLRADVVIVVAGVSGIVMDLELERAGLHTLLLESGGLAPTHIAARKRLEHDRPVVVSVGWSRAEQRARRGGARGCAVPVGHRHLSGARSR